MAQATVTLSVPGSAQELVDWGRSIVKAGLGRLNARTGGNPRNLDGEGNPLPYTVEDVDVASGTEIQKAAEIILQDIAENLALSWDAREAEVSAGQAVRSRPEVSQIKSSIV